MKYIKATCQVCGNEEKVVTSANALAKDICAKCIVENIDISEAEELRRLSMTLQIPFSLKHYHTYMLTNHSNPVKAMDEYLEYLSKEDRLNYKEEKIFEWNEIDKHYNSSLNYIIALAEIKPLREAIEARGKVKWGNEFTFQQIMKLEDIYENTVKQYNITSSLQQDAIRKAAKLSIKMDSLIDGGEFKDLKDATSAQAQFLKTADIKDLAETAKSDDTITTVNDLAFYLEKNGFQFSKMLPDIPQDAIDELMENYMTNVKDVVYNATGLDTQLQDLIEQIKLNSEEELLAQEAEAIPLSGEELEDFLEEKQKEADRELENEELETDLSELEFY